MSYFAHCKATVQISKSGGAYELSDDVINQVAESVATWLSTTSGKGYISTAQALADENVDMTGLIAAYTYDHTNWTQT